MAPRSEAERTNRTPRPPSQDGGFFYARSGKGLHPLDPTLLLKPFDREGAPLACWLCLLPIMKLAQKVEFPGNQIVCNGRAERGCSGLVTALPVTV